MPDSQSFFLFGPRQTGKSTLVDHAFAKGAWKIDLLMTDVFLRYAKYPDLFRREALEKIEREGIRWIIVDEVQEPGKQDRYPQGLRRYLPYRGDPGRGPGEKYWRFFEPCKS